MDKGKNNIKTQDFDAIRISIASPDEILDWSHGEVTKPETINYRTQKAERDGLFCEKIFGPTKDYECYCGKYKKIRYKGVVCDKCGVEVTRSSVRRERMGHINLSVPIAHIWYVRSVPSRMAVVLDISPRDVEKVIYFADYIVLEVNEEIRKNALASVEKEYIDFKSQLKDPNIQKSSKTSEEQKEQIERAYMAAKADLTSLLPKKIISENKYLDLSMKYGQIVKVSIGAEAIYELLKNLDLEKEIEDLKKIVASKDRLQNKKSVKRLKIINGFIDAGIRPEWMILRVLPVIPPDLRPMVQLDGGRFATADLNDLYRRIINRNNRLKKLLEQNSPEVICRNEKRMLQEAVDALIDSAARRDKTNVQRRTFKELKSLSDMLRGKEGRFRQNLLGKRVDYSGRSVIVVGPDLKLNQCGIPKNMALELFKPFVIGKLISAGFAHNVKNASAIIERKELVVWDILEEITSAHLVLLNRAPTLHRLGIQAFQPVLIEGKAIQVHPLVCTAYNADFDGDQMAVYIPLSRAATEETGKIMLSSANVLKPATGEPIVAPSCDIVLGCYFLTLLKEKALGENKFFKSKNEAILAYQAKAIDLQAKIKVKMDEEIVETTAGRVIFNQVFPKPFPYINEVMDKKSLKKTASQFFDLYGDKLTAELVDGIKELGFAVASQSGTTFAIEDIKIPAKKKDLIASGRAEVEKITDQYFKGLISERERYEKLVELWSRVKTEVENAMLESFEKTNPIFEMVQSGAKGSVAQLVQVSGMKGQVANPSGKIIEFPVESNYREGFNEFEYFISSHGARKGRTDTALKTADAGYLTRRLVDVAQDVTITSKDCGTKEGIRFSKAEAEKYDQDFLMQINGRILASDIKVSGKTLYKRGLEINGKIAKEITENTAIKEVDVFSILTCKNLWGVCQKCYGIDLSKGKTVEMGTAVGIIAAQAIGEPGTQLTLRTFHIGGVVGEDITQGLPRVEELFEARSPKTPAKISEIDGTATITKDEDLVRIEVKSEDFREEEIDLPEGFKAQVKSGDKVKLREVIAISENKKTIRAKFPAEVKVGKNKIILQGTEKISRAYEAPSTTIVKIKNGDKVKRGTELTEGHRDLEEMYGLLGQRAVEEYLVREIQYIYSLQGVGINDKHIEVIVRQMFSRVRIKDPGDTKYLEGQIVDRLGVEEENSKMKKLNKKPADFEQLILGVSRVALSSESFLSAASFQETTGVLIEAATTGAVDRLRGLKENVIIGRLIPAGTGFKGSK